MQRLCGTQNLKDMVTGPCDFSPTFLHGPFDGHILKQILPRMSQTPTLREVPPLLAAPGESSLPCLLQQEARVARPAVPTHLSEISLPSLKT